MLHATSYLRLTVVRYAGTCSALAHLWETYVIPRVRDTDVLIVDMQNVVLDDPQAAARLVEGCLAELPATHLRFAFAPGIEMPGKLPDVIWHEIDLTPDADAGVAS